MSTPASARTAGVVVTSLIGAATAVVSYTHALDVVRLVHNTGYVAYLIPLFADGLILLCSIAIYAASQVKPGVSPWAWAGLVFGCGVTVAMNVIAGLPGGLGGALVGALTPAVLFVSLEVLAWLLRHGPAPGPRDERRRCPHDVPAGVADAAVTDFLHRRDCLGQDPLYKDIADAWGVDRRKLPARVAAASQPDADPDPEPAGAALNGASA